MKFWWTEILELIDSVEESSKFAGIIYYFSSKKKFNFFLGLIFSYEKKVYWEASS